MGPVCKYFLLGPEFDQAGQADRIELFGTDAAGPISDKPEKSVPLWRLGAVPYFPEASSLNFL